MATVDSHIGTRSSASDGARVEGLFRQILRSARFQRERLHDRGQGFGFLAQPLRGLHAVLSECCILLRGAIEDRHGAVEFIQIAALVRR
ncbi:hypothetical protein QCE47_17890 [Caballeronia sp. LZ025]|uniref:hypothetical protein n=1 Tax=Caballeronia TaxID=1827195 RepID=UPI001FD0F47A|nr:MULTISPECIES: hypothetical protein [Caballeronia]MDR5734182.1 hypothetical protein [Caballeronia sp. LZ025]